MKKTIDDILVNVNNPSRYCGGEYNTPTIKKDAEVSFALCFPDVYEVAMSNNGIKILYYLINNQPNYTCERCFAPWEDMVVQLKENDMPLFSLETYKPLADFDIVGFSLQYELSYTNVLLMLELGKIPLLSSERGENDPLVIAGGPCTCNPEPMTKFFDFFVIGDGEEITLTIVNEYNKYRKLGKSRRDFLEHISQFDGIYVPNVSTTSVKRALIDDLDKAYFPTRVHIPNIEAVHNRSTLEVFRGCTRGCRFCQAGMIYRPVRERSKETLVRYAKEMIEYNGFDEISLTSLSTCDYSDLRGLLQDIKPLADKSNVTIALPSSRVDSFEADFVQCSRLSSITFAPEAGTQRLRDVINKNITEKDIMTSMRVAFERGYTSIKLYFMIGLPTETAEDLAGIVEIAKEIKKLYRETSRTGQPLKLNISTSTFIPKPFTPFQWCEQISLEAMIEKQNYLKTELRNLKVKYNWHEGTTSVLETAFARGDSRLNDVILKAYRMGAIFDAWSEYFNYELWLDAFDKCGVSISDYTRSYDLDEPLAWDIIDMGVSKEYLKKEYTLSLEASLTSDCRNGCKNCGINKFSPPAYEKNCKQNMANKK